VASRFLTPSLVFACPSGTTVHSACTSPARGTYIASTCKLFTNLRSDGNIRYYEYENDKFEYLSEYKSGDPQRGIAFLPKRGINLHENEVLRCFKTVNDAYVEPVSFIVPRRSEMFQSDIYPPTTGSKPGVSAAEWFSGKTAMPPKISLESVYEGEAPKEVENDYKPSQPATSLPSPVKSEPPKPAHEPIPTPVASRGPPPSMKDNKDSMSSAASKFADKDASDNESASSFEEIPKPAERRTFTAARQEEKVKGPVISKEPESAKTTPTPTPAVSSTPASSAAPATATPTASATSSTPSAGGPASALRDALGDIKSQLEQQNRVMSDQSDQIALLLREVSTLKTKVAASEPSDREKDERIRQLELELEEARS
jgi:coronin-1B/1C/6